jgi:branched-chain amino acid transport system permease protein
MPALARHPILAAIAVAVLLAALASQLPTYRLFLVGQLSVLIIVTASMTVLMGAAGLLSLASAAFMGVGGYGVLILAGRYGLPLVLAAPLIVVLGGLLGGVLGLVALRLSGFHLAIVTLGFLQVLLVMLKRGGEITGGGYGLVVPTVAIGDWKLTVDMVATASVAIMVLAVGACASAVRSRIGRAWLALRDNEPAARMMGIDVSRKKIGAFVFASALVSLAGVLQVFLLGVANPASYIVDVSIFHITLVVVGGMTGSLVGAVIAPIILYFLPETFSALGEWRDFFYAAVLMLTLVFLPRGIGPTLVDAFTRRRTAGAAR